MSNYTIVTNFLAKDSLISGNPLKLVKGADFTTEFTAVQTALNSKFDGSTQFAPDGTAGQPSFGFTNNAGTGMYNAAGVLNFATGSTTRLSIATGGLVTASLGLTVAGAAFISRGITDNATATALTISSTGALSIAAPTSTAVALLVNGAANQYAGQFISSSTSGQAYGLTVAGGTTSADRAFHVTNQAQSVAWFDVVGDGSVLVGAPAGGGQGVGTINATGLYQAGNPVYAGAPQTTVNSTYTTILSDANKHIFSLSMSAAQTITIAANASVAYPIGTMISGVNRSGNAYTLACGDTLQWAPSAATGSRTIAANAASWTAIKVQSTVWMLTGIGIT